MKTGMTLSELAKQVEQNAAARRDFKAHEQALEIVPTGAPDGAGIALRIGDAGEFNMREIAQQQMAERTDVPWSYWQRMRREGAGELLARNANHWLKQGKETRMVRTLERDARAILSSSYRAWDNDQMLESTLPVLAEAGVEVRSAAITESRLYLQVTTPKVQGEVKKGDVVQAGLIVSNSEVGRGAFSVELLLYRLVCLNGMVVGNGFRKTHLGRGVGKMGMIGADVVVGDDTRVAEDKAISLRLRDTVKTFLTEEKFQQMLEPLREATNRIITGDPTKAIEVVGRDLGLNETERGGVLRHLIEGGDLSAWGLSNAVTALAHDAKDYDRSVELERAGARVIELDRTAWRRVAEAA